MSELLVLGDEALALGAIDAGLSVAYGYPGTPSTEIMEYLQSWTKTEDPDLLARWCSNEKSATEGAVGVSYAGKRALVTMKHVGLNVAMDAFMNACLVKIHGGLVFAVADDPGMHSSQNEQDTRYLADFAHTICFEPSNHQEAYEMAREAFEVSERYHIPVVIKMVTRLSHSRSIIRREKGKAKSDLSLAPDKWGWLTLPSISRQLWQAVLDKQELFRSYTEQSPFNRLSLSPGQGQPRVEASGDTEKLSLGVITTGLGGNYYLENRDEMEPHHHLHLGVYPAPEELIKKLASQVDRIVLLEEGYPFIERQLGSLLGNPLPLEGKGSGHLPSQGELNPDNVRSALGLAPRKQHRNVTIPLPGRPPQLCAGCPHTDTFKAINEARSSFPESIVTGDIGCYALGALPPHSAVETILCMGASVGMAKGAAEAGRKPVLASIGDSTFIHSGIPGLIDAVASRANMTLVILDNITTAMTGGQDTILGSKEIKNLVIACGVDPDHVKSFVPLPKNHHENVTILKEEMDFEGVSVVIPFRECVQTQKSRNLRKNREISKERRDANPQQQRKGV